MEKITQIAAPYALSTRWQVALWVLAIAVLGVTFFGYGQVELLVQWVNARLC